MKKLDKHTNYLTIYMSSEKSTYVNGQLISHTTAVFEFLKLRFLSNFCQNGSKQSS